MICEVSEGSRGVLGGPFEVRRVMKSLGRGREVPGRFRGVSWRGPWNPWFSLFQRWICQRSNEILMFWVRGRFVKRSVVIWLCYFCICFGSLLFAKQWGEHVIKTKVFWMSPIWHLQILMKIWCRKHDFGRWHVRPLSIRFEGNRSCFSTISLFNN